MIARPVYVLAFLVTTEWLVSAPLVPPIATAEACVSLKVNWRKKVSDPATQQQPYLYL